MKISKRALRRQQNRLGGWAARMLQPKMKLDGQYGYLTIFHDYEGAYAFSDKAEASYYGVSQMLDIEKKYGVKTTYNTVGKLSKEVPDIIQRILEEGHEIASHSYKHDLMTSLSRKELEQDLKATVAVFEEQNIKIKGVRSPQGQWTFRQMQLMVEHGMIWSAESDPSDVPYFILPGRLMRFPIKEADYYQYARGRTPAQVNESYLAVVDHILAKKSYGAIGFHPWVQGEQPERLAAFDKLLMRLSAIENLKIVTFEQMYDLMLKG